MYEYECAMQLPYTPKHKNNSKKNNLNIRGQHRNDIRENIEANPHDLVLSSDFFY